MFSVSKRIWLLAAILLSLPGSALAMGGEGLAQGIFYLILMAGSFVALLMVAGAALLGKFIFNRSVVALWVAIGLSIVTPIGLIVRYGITYPASRPDLQFLMLLAMAPIILMSMIVIAVTVCFLPKRTQVSP